MMQPVEVSTTLPLWQQPRFWRGLAVVLVGPALFSHLGLLPVDTISDEPRRALVALEMRLSGDYVTPTLNGVPYLNKPPLYNWLIALSFGLFGNYSSFALRFPMIVSLLGFALTVFGFVRHHVGTGSPRQDRAVAFAAAFMLLTNVRILLYDSLLGLIDTAFSWVTYTAFLLVHHFDARRRYVALFLTTYALTAAGFLMKGLPSVVFQGITLLAWFGATRRWRLLVGPAHGAGILLFLALVGGYYVAYFSRNPIAFADVATVLLRESAKRTGATYGLGAVLLHVLTFPAEVFYHFAPWPLLALLLFRRGIGYVVAQNRFILFNAVTFGANVVVYWTSPEVYARYVIMLMPLLFTVLAWLYYVQTPATAAQRRWTERIWLAGAVVLTLGCWIAPFHPEVRVLPNVVAKTLATFGALALLLVHYVRQVSNRLVLLVVFMVMVRIGFNWLILPPRLAARMPYKDGSERVARRTIGPDGRPRPLYAYKQTITDDGATNVNSFHIAATRGQILRLTDKKYPGAYYVADSVALAGERYVVLDTFRLFDNRPAWLVQFRP